MFILIAFGVIAVIALVALTIFNMKAASAMNKTEPVLVKRENKQMLLEHHSNNAGDTGVQDSTEQRNVSEEKNMTIDDNAYRNALKSFQTEIKKMDTTEQQSNKMNDNDFRRALRSMSEKPKDIE
jgi:carbon starvation protein CstA